MMRDVLAERRERKRERYCDCDCVFVCVCRKGRVPRADEQQTQQTHACVMSGFECEMPRGTLLCIFLGSGAGSRAGAGAGVGAGGGEGEGEAEVEVVVGT